MVGSVVVELFSCALGVRASKVYGTYLRSIARGSDGAAGSADVTTYQGFGCVFSFVAAVLTENGPFAL